MTLTLNKREKKINAPFGYFGSKNKIALQLCSDLPLHNCWVEVFCGSASVTLRKKPAEIEVINDIDKEIFNFFTQLRNNHEELCRVISLTPYAREELLVSRTDHTDGDLERARRFLVSSMMAVNGVFGEEQGGFSCSHSYSRNGREARVNRWYNLPERLVQVVERLRNVRVDNKDALELIKMYMYRPATLLYLDPPYFAERTSGYSIDANDESFHTNLLKLINKANCMIFISGYDNDLYNSFLTEEKGWSKKEINTTTKDSTGNSYNRIEIVWMNKYYNNTLTTKKIPVNFTKAELRDKKINPERKSYKI